MDPGETILGLDFGNHLWIVLSIETDAGLVALANLTTHGRQRICGSGCVVVGSGEHEYPSRDSCVYYRGAILNPVRPLDDARIRGVLQQREPFDPDLLLRVQHGALASRMTSQNVKDAIRRTLDRPG